MRALRRSATAVLVTALLSAGCAKTYAPSGWLPSPDEAPADGFGAWLQLEYRYTGNLVASAGGELIAVGADSIYVLVPQGYLLAVSRPDVIQAQLEAYDARLGGVAAWGVVGTLSTISHGFYLVLTAPAWIVFGTVAASVHSREPIARYPDESLTSFAAMARFPQGLPPDVDRAYPRSNSLGEDGEQRPPQRWTFPLHGRF